LQWVSERLHTAQAHGLKLHLEEFPVNVTAIHEAGHKAMCDVLGVRTHGYVLEEDYAAVVMDEPPAEFQQAILCAGAAAEIAYFGEIKSTTQQLRSDLELFGSWKSFEKAATGLSMLMDPDSLVTEATIAAETFN
jgi:hypothetical protein